VPAGPPACRSSRSCQSGRRLTWRALRTVYENPFWGLGMLAKMFGAVWAASYVSEVLFPPAPVGAG
jgi:hypothetical protein